MHRLASLFGRLWSTYWFLPFAVTAAALVVGELLVAADRGRIARCLDGYTAVGRTERAAFSLPWPVR